MKLSMLAAGFFMASMTFVNAANAATIFDNGAPIGGGSGADAWVLADDFTLSADTQLTGAGIYIAGYGGIANWDGHVRWFVFDNAGNRPGSVLATAQVMPTPVDSGIPSNLSGSNYYLLEFAIDFTAAADTPYWFGIHAADDGVTRSRNIVWGWTDANASLSIRTGRPYDLENWTAGNRHQAFYLIGDAAAVPEPASWAMMIAGFGLIGAAARRRMVHAC